jgi:response regulator of citrate/malate metabolism
MQELVENSASPALVVYLIVPVAKDQLQSKLSWYRHRAIRIATAVD